MRLVELVGGASNRAHVAVGVLDDRVDIDAYDLDVSGSVFVSILALGFTVGSFYWIQVRRGRLRSYKPRTYAGFYGQQMHLVLPLVLHNTGPAPIVATDFRLILDVGIGPADRQQDGFRLPIMMPWSAIQASIHPGKELGPSGGRVHPSPIPVEGRRAVEHFIEFAAGGKKLDLAAGPYSARIEVLLGHTDRWRELVTFPLHTQLATDDTSARFITRTNDPTWSLDGSDPRISGSPGIRLPAPE